MSFSHLESRLGTSCPYHPSSSWSSPFFSGDHCQSPYVSWSLDVLADPPLPPQYLKLASPWPPEWHIMMELPNRWRCQGQCQSHGDVTMLPTSMRLFCVLSCWWLLMPFGSSFWCANHLKFWKFMNDGSAKSHGFFLCTADHKNHLLWLSSRFPPPSDSFEVFTSYQIQDPLKE